MVDVRKFGTAHTDFLYALAAEPSVGGGVGGGGGRGAGGGSGGGSGRPAPIFMFVGGMTEGVWPGSGLNTSFGSFDAWLAKVGGGKGGRRRVLAPSH